MKSPRLLLSVLAVGLLSGLAGCATPTARLPLYDAPRSSTVAPDEVRIQYLGVGGHLVRHGGESLLLAPSFTNPAFLGQPPAVGLMRTDTRKVDRLLPDVSGVDMLLVGHAHYDHLLDVPYILLRHASRARVYGSSTTKHILAAAIPAWRLEDVEAGMARDGQPGRWYVSPSGRLRVMPIRSEHAPHFAGLAFMSGHYSEDLTRLPGTMWGWLEGQTLAYLVDFLDAEGRPEFRLFYQDSAGHPALGFLPALRAADGKAVDVAILCVASHDNIEKYPAGVLDVLQPRQLVLGHWEDFFGNDPAHPEGVRLTDIDRFLGKLKDSAPGVPWFLPRPLAEMSFHAGATPAAR
ncbi:MBL fold metallo-hydrolase [Myxococcaceae bacterium GXIMD 01537]